MKVLKEQLTKLPSKIQRGVAQKALKPISAGMKQDIAKALRTGIKTTGATKRQRLRSQAKIARLLTIITKIRPSKQYYMKGVGIKKVERTVANQMPRGAYAYLLRKGTKSRVRRDGSRTGKIEVSEDYVETLWKRNSPKYYKKAQDAFKQEVKKWDS